MRKFTVTGMRTDEGTTAKHSMGECYNNRNRSKRDPLGNTRVDDTKVYM